MKYVQPIDRLTMTKRKLSDGRWVSAKPEPATGLFGFKVRLYKAWYVFIGKADAVYYIEE